MVKDERMTTGSLEEELKLLETAFKLTYSLEKIGNVMSIIFDYNSIMIAFSIPSMSLYVSQIRNPQKKKVVTMDICIGLNFEIQSQVLKAIEDGATIKDCIEQITALSR
jgi:hypothetical protein